MYELSITRRFSAAHHLAGYPGSCASHHGHNWEVGVSVTGHELDDTGILLDFRTLKETVDGVLEQLDHKDLSALDAFADRNPTSENIARFIYQQVAARLGTRVCRVSRVCVKETPDSEATYSEP
jgi:6-pyruvoyltetrahydropterin/6-carboxytetrahydropterin synthase